VEYEKKQSLLPLVEEVEIIADEVIGDVGSEKCGIAN